MSEAGGMSEQAISSAAASLRGPTSWEYSVRKHCEVLTIPLDLRETGWMLLKLKKFVNAVCVYCNGRTCCKNPARRAEGHWGLRRWQRCPRTRLRSQRGM